MDRTMTARRLLLASVTLLALAGSAHAQDPGRLDRLEKQVRELRAIVFQGRDTGQPVEVKLAGPDPAVSSLEQRMDDVTNQLRQISGQLEVMTHDADEARHAAQSVRDQNGELRGRLQDLSDRVARLEAQLAPGAAAGGGQIPPPPVDNSIPPPPSAGGGAGPQPTDATAAAQSADTGRLGGPSSAPGAAPPPEAAAPPAAPTAADLYRAARGKVTSGDYAGASSAFQDYVTRYPTAKNLSEAYYWMGESDYAREDFQDATPAYARALKGWPKSPWAGDATVKLARALAETNRAPEACAALTEFDHRYGGAASPTTKARAEAVRKRAQCGG
jgi:tol-pal system protein YbgF